MHVSVTGKRVSRELKQDLEEASVFYANLLLPKRTVSTIGLEIIIDRNMPVQAECVYLGDREFEITIRNSKGDAHPVRCLAHEMVHLKQYVRGEFTYTSKENKVVELWKGEVYKFKKGEHPYYDAPWEIEAYGREPGLYARWESSDLCVKSLARRKIVG